MDSSGFSLIVMATSGLCPIESVCASPVTSRKFTSIYLGAMTDQFLRIHNIKPSCRPYPAHFPEPPSPPPSQPPLPSMAHHTASHLNPPITLQPTRQLLSPLVRHPGHRIEPWSEYDTCYDVPGVFEYLSRSIKSIAPAPHCCVFAEEDCEGSSRIVDGENGTPI